MKFGNYIRVGKRDVKLTTPSHVPGVQEGNEGPGREDSPARRSTGISPKRHAPLLEAMPKLTPA